MTFKPNTRQLETIADMGHARASTKQIAAALVDEIRRSVRCDK
jgi:hypothetical protein